MAEEQSLNDDLDSFAAALAALTPRPVGFNRDRLMYDICHAKAVELQAGNRTILNRWRFATGASTVAALIFAGLWFTRSGNPLIVDEQASHHASAPSETPVAQDLPLQLQGLDLRMVPARSTNPIDVHYIIERNRALDEGVDRISTVHASSGENLGAPLTNQQIWDSVLNSRELGG